MTSILGLRPAALAIACLAGLPGGAQTVDLRDLQLPLLPRTADEAARIRAVTAPTGDFTAPERFEAKPAGAATVRARSTADAFSDPSANIGLEGRMTFNLGNGLFTKPWVSAPSSTASSDGLGPLFNARACQLCHLKDGRGLPPASADEDAVALFLRLSVPSDTSSETGLIPDWIATSPDPIYGGQLQNFSLAGIPAEGRMQVETTEVPLTFPDGATITMHLPSYSLADPGYGAPAPGLMVSPRVAQQMIGLGLLEAIPAAEILAHADPDDADGDGISGRANIVMSRRHHAPMLGRFGHKAGMPTIEEQSAAAFSGDMGLSTPLHPSGHGDCTARQAACVLAETGADTDGLEVSAENLDLVTFYARNLGVPERRDVDDQQVLRGKAIFYAAGCADCHVPKYVTGRMKDAPAQSFQLIWPYSDLLLHDMGEGLADHRPEGRATGTEWRTAPLWGIGLTAQVSGRESYLHDGRATSLIEAVMWHGGEAQPARDRVYTLSQEDRDALIRFLGSL
ncbi:c-type cytochrome [Defluviimonas sp. WL0002]|uniref:C-type cytochrome n=1 Tax=Albidovulum marisflavi TaxID=2984159 RepID=A0ABT2ZCW1_9RHOB|nr:di-heme oxidoredictase family protein [Defluviimonas sp. WL0002]MCV2868926.1 c-type cytochrome [Defluviimonas sp. WL0002]